VTDELRDELDRLAAGAPTPDERRDQVMRAARRRSRVGMAVAGVVAVTAVLVGVLAVGAVLDRRETRPIGPTPTGVVRVSPTGSSPPPADARGELAYFRDGPFGGSAQLVVRNADGSGPRTIGDLSISTSRLSIAPDGSQAVFDHGLGEGSGQLEVIDLSTGAAHMIFDVGQPQGPDWSPDGSTIVFSTDSGALFTIPSGGGTTTPVRDEGDGRFLEGSQASWSPDGDSLVAVDEAGDVFVLEVDGTSPARRLRSIGDAGWTDWGPDGIVVSTTVHGEWALYLLDPENEAPPRLLLDRPGDETAPAFSPDGGFLAFVGNDGDQQDLFVMDVGSGAVDRLTDDAAQELSPAWIPSS
jgi:Tol biopolymer transport system component